jgi:hypothetical protein
MDMGSLVRLIKKRKKKEKKKDWSSSSSGSRAPVAGNPASVGAPPHRLGPPSAGFHCRPALPPVCLGGLRPGGARRCLRPLRRSSPAPGKSSSEPALARQGLASARPNSPRWTSPHPRPTHARVLPRRASTRARTASRHAHRRCEEPREEVAPELAAPPDAMLTATAKSHGIRSRCQGPPALRPAEPAPAAHMARAAAPAPAPGRPRHSSPAPSLHGATAPGRSFPRRSSPLGTGRWRRRPNFFY